MAPHKESSLVSTPQTSDEDTHETIPAKMKISQQTPVDGEFEVKNSEHTQEQKALFNAEFALKPRKLRIITIGAGFSGLLIAHKFQHRFPELQEFVDHTIFESRSDIGGTWLVNTYPGVQCDVPSHIYVS
jgi:hypothetical protein